MITQPPGVGDYFADGQRLCQLAAVNDPRGEYVIAEDCQSEALFTIRLRDLSRRWWKITPRA